MKPILVLCLGNEVLSDDSFGPRIAEILNDNHSFEETVEVISASLAGFNLLDLLKERQSILVVDTIVSGKAKPGTLHFFPAGQLTASNNLISSHQINLPTAVRLGTELGIDIPEDIDVLAVEALDVETLGENLTAPVTNAIDRAVSLIMDWVQSKIEKSKKDESRKKASTLT